MGGSLHIAEKRPNQAVILAGGRGTRLGVLTRDRPKPMVEVRGKPFLSYQVEQLRDQGFDRILLLLGYRAEVVQDYFGDGERWGVSIEYSVTAAEDETARRLRIARPKLDSRFLLLYCDNYWPMQMDRMWPRFVDSGAPAMITVYSNRDGYTRNSVRVGADGYVEVYDKNCATPGLQGVEISYAIIDRGLVELLPDENVSVEEALYTRLANRKQLAAFVTDHRYYSVGALHRLPLTEAFFERRPALIVDRDGVLNRKPPRARYVRSWSEFEWLPGAREALKLMKETNRQVVVVSNQAGVGRGMMTESDLEDIHDRMKRDASEAGGRIDAVYYCPHDWSAGCDCRKPGTGLLFQAQRDFNLDLTLTPFVGDDPRDRAAAEAAGCPFEAVTPETSFLDIARRISTPNEQEQLAQQAETRTGHGA